MRPLSEIPTSPPWVAFACRMACLDACDWSDRWQVEACLGFALTDAQWETFTAAVSRGILYASDVVVTEGWVEAVRPNMEEG